MIQDRFHTVNVADKLDLPADASEWSEADFKLSIMAGYVDAANIDLAPVNAVIAEETAKINEAARNVERMDTWFGRLTGQHFFAQAKLNEVQQRSGRLLDEAYASKDAKVTELADEMQNGVGSPGYEKPEGVEDYARELMEQRAAKLAQDEQGVSPA